MASLIVPDVTSRTLVQVYANFGPSRQKVVVSINLTQELSLLNSKLKIDQIQLHFNLMDGSAPLLRLLLGNNVVLDLENTCPFSSANKKDNQVCRTDMQCSSGLCK